jgi:phosphotriesterase-related protein
VTRLEIPDVWLGQVMTVRGLVPAERMGITLPHEHLLARHQGPLVDTVDPVLAREEMQRFVRFGGRTVVDMTNSGLGPNPAVIRQISAEASVNIIAGTGYYKDAWLPAEVHDLSVAEMEATMVREIVEGFDGTGIHAGVIGEIGVSRPTTATEERVLAAAARAQRRTGAAINVHFDIGGESEELNHAVDILENEGADLNRVVLDHFICRPDELPVCKQLAGRGCYVEFDLWGMETWPKILELTRNTLPEVQIASLRWFITAGMLEKILISQDVANIVNLRKYGGYGQSHILKNLLPQFRDYGITDEHIRTLMVENPRRLFPFQPLPA